MIDRPKMVLEDFFSGRCRGWGIMQGRFGRYQNQFKIEAEGKWISGSEILQLTETYTFDDGHVDQVNWEIAKQSPQRYAGREATILGEADGTQDDHWFRWRYRRKVPQKDGSSVTLGFDDCFWRQDEDTLIARAEVTKYGILIAMMTVCYQRLS